MKFVVERNWVDVIGKIWMPSITCASRINLTARDVAHIGEPTRENVEQWLTNHTGGYQWVDDFTATVGETVIPWKKGEESASVYEDCCNGR